MSSQAYSRAPLEATRRRLSTRQAETVERLTSAAATEVRATSYDGLTVRGVARRAGVAAATAYTYFTSKDHLLTEVYWRRLQALADHAGGGLHQTLSSLALLVADEPELAAACTTALLSHDPEVVLLRQRIGAEMRRRVAEALGDDASPGVVDGVELLLTGALVQAGMGHVAYADLPARLSDAAGLLLGAER